MAEEISGYVDCKGKGRALEVDDGVEDSYDPNDEGESEKMDPYITYTSRLAS
jgi:hypothetical protein